MQYDMLITASVLLNFRGLQRKLRYGSKFVPAVETFKCEVAFRVTLRLIVSHLGIVSIRLGIELKWAVSEIQFVPSNLSQS